jgi:hypothetical protein
MRIKYVLLVSIISLLTTSCTIKEERQIEESNFDIITNGNPWEFQGTNFINLYSPDSTLTQSDMENIKNDLILSYDDAYEGTTFTFYKDSTSLINWPNWAVENMEREWTLNDYGHIKWCLRSDCYKLKLFTTEAEPELRWEFRGFKYHYPNITYDIDLIFR